MINPMFDAFLRAVAYCLHPRVILLSLLPLLIAGGGVWILGVYFWESAIDGINAWLHTWSLVDGARQWLVSVGWGNVFSMLPIVVLLALAVPAIVLVTLLLVAIFMVPSIVNLVAARRFPALQRREGGSFLSSVGWSLGCTALAAVALVASIPLWFIPPLVLIVPPLIWGWLSYKVMTFDVLADHADRDERRRILREQRWPLLAIGIVTGYLGSAPTLIWGIGAMALPLAPVLMPISLWLYTLVFAFSALWFAHFTLASLHAMRLQAAATVRPVEEVIDLPPAPPSPLPPPKLP